MKDYFILILKKHIPYFILETLKIHTDMKEKIKVIVISPPKHKCCEHFSLVIYPHRL